MRIDYLHLPYETDGESGMHTGPHRHPINFSSLGGYLRELERKVEELTQRVEILESDNSYVAHPFDPYNP